jgi:beta-glucosidase
LTIGKYSGEFIDRNLNTDFMLTGSEQAAIGAVSKAFHDKGKKVIVVLNIGGVIETASWRDKADAILLAWQGGLESGNAIADILKGKVNPSGKLATTFPLTYTDEPSTKNFPGKVLEAVPGKLFMVDADPSEVIYEEGIYVGYRYFNTFKVKPAYPFGHGLSYTNFEYSGLKLSASTFTDQIKVEITIKNSGKMAGKEAVQLYLAAPKSKLDKPESELKAFGKTKLLQPNESQALTFTLSATDLASFDPNLSAWVADGGVYTVKIGRSALDIEGQATFTLPETKVLGKTPRILLPQKTVVELKRGNR